MREIEARAVSWTVGPVGKPCYDESITQVRIVDESDGEFIEIQQVTTLADSTIRLDADEWPVLRATIDKAVKACRDV
jgi:hypothetical protein